jgi:hypothetical protein
MTDGNSNRAMNPVSVGPRSRLIPGPVNGLLLLASIAVSLIVIEAGYRAYLFMRTPANFTEGADLKSIPAIGVYDRSLWEYDAELGYRYAQGPIHLSHVDGGQVTSCTTISPTNDQGNMGHIARPWEEGVIKVAVFGDSFSAFVTPQGVTWPEVLRERLERRLGRPVSLVNFGRDGIGILQMFDMMATLLPKWRPDLVIVAFITDDITRVRIWRTSVTIDGEPRVLVTDHPDPNPAPHDAGDVFILHPDASAAWCQSMSYRGHLDRIGSEIVDKYRRFRMSNGAAAISLFTLRRSLAFDRIVYGNAFFRLRRPGRLILQDYEQEPRMRDSVRRVEETGIPYLLVHLPIYPEVLAGRETVASSQEQRLLSSLERMTGRTIFGVLDVTARPIDHPERMNVTPDNYHPSLWGMEFYAEAVDRMLLENGLTR